MSIPLQVSEWSDVKGFYPEEEEIKSVCIKMSEEQQETFHNQVFQHESQWMDRFEERNEE